MFYDYGAAELHKSAQSEFHNTRSTHDTTRKTWNFNIILGRAV